MFVADTFNAKEFWNEGGLLLFPHVPKTGGTSIRRILSNCLDDEVFLFETAVLEPFEYSKYMLKTTLPRNSGRIRLIIGHMPFGLHVLFPDRPVKYVSVVRDPLDRLASNYLHDYNHHVLLQHGDLLVSCDGLVEYAEALRARSGGEILTRFAHNHQCRILFPELVDEIAASGGAPADRDGFLQKVRALAEKWYVLIGAQEALGEFNSRLLALLGKGETEEVRENTRYGSDSRQIFSASDRATIEQWNEYDRHLFGFVCGEAQLASPSKAPSDSDQIRLIADIRLKALRNCRSSFMALTEDRQKAQRLGASHRDMVLQLEARFLALTEDRQKAQQIMEAQRNLILQLEAEFLALTEERQKAQYLVESQRNMILKLEAQITAPTEDRQKAQHLIESHRDMLLQLEARFLALTEDRQKAQQIMESQRDMILQCEAQFLALIEDRQKAQQIMEAQRNMILQHEAKLEHL